MPRRIRLAKERRGALEDSVAAVKTLCADCEEERTRMTTAALHIKGFGPAAQELGGSSCAHC